LQDLDAVTIAPLMRALQSDASEVLRALSEPAAAARLGPGDAAKLLAAAVDGTLPADPNAVRTALIRAGNRLPLGVLQRLVDRVSARERAEDPAIRGEWTAVRGAIHAALASRGSRIVLYDLRETIELAKEPLTDDFLSAAGAIGDASCLEAIAAAFSRAGTTDSSAAWRRRLREAFRRIAAREKITRRHAVLKKIDRRWPGTLDALTRT
jgi:hypothetical protein